MMEGSGREDSYCAIAFQAGIANNNKDKKGQGDYIRGNLIKCESLLCS